MTLRFEALIAPTLPKEYVLIGVYGGTSKFPMGTFYVLRCWWESFRLDHEFVFVDSKEIEVLNVC